MADENRDEELPQRVKGVARLSPARSAPASALPEELRQRMRAAVDAERAETRERAGQPGQPAAASPPAAADDGVAAATNGTTGPVNGRDKGSGKPPTPPPAANNCTAAWYDWASGSRRCARRAASA